jgi:nucleoside-diphosphate-sugar epimerase
MARDNALLLTGATGTLGGWLVRAALSDGVSVCALVRRESGKSSRKRLEACLAEIGVGRSPNLHVVEGDILQDTLGFDPDSLPVRIGMVVHCAASTELQDYSSGLTDRTNVEGVRHILAWAHRHRTPLVHVSSAYVAGDRSGWVFENELDVGQGFRNPYELAKCRGESLVRQWASETNLPAIILRPSIVMGDWSSGRIVRFSMIYDMMRVLNSLDPTVCGPELRIVAHPQVTKNLIPVDYFADVAWRLIRRDLPGTYHIVNPRPPTFADLQRFFTELFRLDSLRLVSPEEFSRQPANKVERVCYRALRHYSQYMLCPEPQFDTTATDAALGDSGPAAPLLDVDYFGRLLAYARQADWGRKTVAAPLDADREKTT